MAAKRGPQGVTGIGSYLPELQIERNNIRDEVYCLGIMSVPNFQHRQMTVEDAAWGRQPYPGSKETTVEGCQGVVAGVKGVGLKVCFIAREILSSGLHLIPVKWRHGKEGGQFDRRFQTGRMRSDTPAVGIIPVITPKNKIVSEKIVYS